MAHPAIEARDLVKVYPNGLRANDGVSFSVDKGEIHALVGENGAGKSTLVKMLYGLERPTHGQIFLNGQPVSIPNAQAAIRMGIGMVHQNFMLIPSFTLAENIVLNAEPRRGPWVDMRTATEKVRALAEQYGLAVTPDLRTDSAPVGMRQRAEILKALYRGAEIFILDEPTAVLTPNETADLFAALRNLIGQGKTIIFITHKLREVKNISDRVTVMRDGRVIGVLRTAEADEAVLARMMVGREVFMQIHKPPLRRGDVILTVHNLSCRGAGRKLALDQMSFSVYAGEILGVAGVEGNGQTELAEVLSGLRPATSGTVRVGQTPILGLAPRQVREAGVAHIPEDRLTNGAALDVPIEDNLIVDRYYRPPQREGGLLRPHNIAQNARRLIREFGIVAHNGQMLMRALSGGNMQKVIVARELTATPRLLIAAQPTRGVDIGAIEFIHQQLIDQRSAGLAILLISADLQEVIKLADRLIVIHGGRIAAVFTDPLAVSEEALGLYMLGARHQSAQELEAAL